MALPTLSEFASQNPSDDPLDLYKRYSDYTKTELLKAGEWDDELVDSIDANLIGKAQVEGIDLGPDPFATLHNRATDEAKVRDLRQLEADADERKDPVATTAIRDYAGMLSPQVKQAYTDPVAYNTKLQQLEEAAAPYLSDTEAINRARRRAVERGETPVAVVKRGDNMDVELSPALMSYVGDDQGLGMLLENHPEVPRSLIPQIRQKLAVPEGYKAPIMAFERQADFFAAAEKDYGAPAAEAAQAMSEGDFGKMDGIVNSAVFGLKNNFGTQFSENELRGYFTDMVKQRANPDLGGQNPLLELSTGQVVAPLNLAFDKEKFNAAIDAAQIPDVQKARLREDRVAQLDTAAPSIFGVIAGYDPNFVPFKEKMVREGKSNAEILDTWNANPERKTANDVYLSQTGAGIKDAILGIPLGLAALSGSDTAKNIMVQHMKEDGARRAYSQLMGRNTGIGYDLLSVAPQLGADIAIAVGTGGAGAELAATRVTAKSALKIAMKDMLGAEAKSLANSYMRNIAGDVTADQVYKLAARDMAGYLTPKLTEAAFLGTAFTRSAGSAYASISSALGAKGVPADQVRSTALGHALIAGTITAAITKGMSVFGHGGMETIFDDLSRPQLTRVFNKAKAEWDNLAPELREGIDMTSANKMLASIMTKAVKPIFSTALHHGASEGVEEGLDQFSQYINEKLATGDKVNLADAAREAGYAALLGGVMGAGIPAIRDTYHSVSGKEAPQVLQDAARTRLFTDTAAKLDKANSPQAAAVMRALANQAPATRSVPEAVPPAGPVAPPSGQAVAGAEAVTDAEVDSYIKEVAPGQFRAEMPGGNVQEMKVKPAEAETARNALRESVRSSLALSKVAPEGPATRTISPEGAINVDAEVMPPNEAASEVAQPAPTAPRTSRAGTRSGLVASADQSTPTPTTREAQSQVPQAGAPAALEGQSTQSPATGSLEEGAAQRSGQDQEVIDITSALAEPPTPVEVAATAAAPEIALREDPDTLTQAKDFLQSKGFSTEGLRETDVAKFIQEEFTPRQKPETAAKPGQIRSELERHGFSQGLTPFLQSVAKSGEPRYRQMAKLLLGYPELLANTPVSLVDMPNSEYAGVMIPSTGQVVVNEASTGPRGAVDTVIHELLHAATIRALHSPTEAQRKFLGRLDRLRETLSRRAAAEGIPGMEYALGSNDEFITHWFTSPKFQENVGKLTQKGERNLIQVILDAIKQLITGKPVSQIDRSINDLMGDMLTFTKGALDTTWGQSRMDQLMQQPKAYRDLSRMEELQSLTQRTPAQEAELRGLEVRQQPSGSGVPSDEDYMAAVQRGDTATAQQMVDAAAKAAGYESKVFHGTKRRGFTVFDRQKAGKGVVSSNRSGGFYFSDSRDAAAWFADATSLEKTSDVELSEDDFSIYGEGPFFISENQSGLNTGPYSTEAEAENAASLLARKWNSSDIGDTIFEDDNVMDLFVAYKNPLRVDTIRDFRDAELTAKSEGYDAIIAEDVVDGDMPSTVTIVFDPNQIKSADPVTYDENGQVIPLSQRFNPATPDIRFQPAEAPDHAETLRQADEAGRAALPESEDHQHLTDTLTHVANGLGDLRAPDYRVNPERKSQLITYLKGVVDHLAKAPFDPETATTLDRAARFLAKAKDNFITRPQAPPLDLDELQPRFQVSEMPEPFYSALTNVIDAKVQGRSASPEQLKALIDNPSNGVKAEEIKWSGVKNRIDQLATENGGKVPKDALLNWLSDEGAVRFEEVTTGMASRPEIRAEDAEDGTPGFSIYDNGEFVEWYETRNEAEANLPNLERSSGGTKYAQYTLPGGENYREVVLAMPETRMSLATATDIAKEAAEASGQDWDEMTDQQRQEAIRDARSIAGEEGEPRVNYTSSHFPDVPNYVAHMRLNERTDAAGKPGLFIEELQSDRHQAGRKKGYKGDVTLEQIEAARSRTSHASIALQARAQEIRVENPELPQMLREIRSAPQSVQDHYAKLLREDATYAKLNAEYEAAKVAQDKMGESEGVIPDAPYRTSWPLALFKRALRDAVASGKEWIGWTNGETQNDRFDLSKQVDSIIIPYIDPERRNVSVYLKEDHGDYFALSVTNDGTVTSYDGRKPELNGKSLDDVIGKDMADKIMSATEETEFRGEGLKVGGSGMKGFYDNMLPKEIGKYVERLGKGKVEKAELPPRGETVAWAFKDADGVFRVKDKRDGADPSAKVLGEFDNADAAMAFAHSIKPDAIPIWHIDITPEMAKSVSTQGQPLFQPSESTDPKELTNYLHAWDGYKFASLNPDHPQPGLKGFLKRIFTQENDMRKPWREAMKAMGFTRTAAAMQGEAAARPFAEEFQKAIDNGADADKLTSTIGAAIGTTAPMLTEDEALRIHDETDQKLLAAKADFDAKVAAATAERGKVSRSESLRAEKLKKQKAKVRREGKKLINPTPEEQAAYDALVAEQSTREAALMEARGKLKTLEDTLANLEADHAATVQQIMADDQTARIKSELEFAKEARRVQDLAMQDLTASHPELAKAVGDMRDLLNAFQDEVYNRMGHRPELQMKIDRSRGIYLVRSYRLHRDPSLGQRILHDEKYQELRDRTITFFEQKFADQWVAKVKDAASKTEAQVTEEAGNLRLSAMEKELRKLAAYASYPDSDLRVVAQHEVEQQARHAFEDFIIGRTNLSAEVPGLESIKVDAARFMKKGNVPQEIRDALLENTDPLFNATHTFNALANIVVQHDMLTRFRDAGLKQGWLTDADGVKSNPDRYKGWRPVVTANEGNAAWSNMAGIYAAPEDIEAFHSAFKTGSKRYDNSAAKALGFLNKKLTGFAGLSLGIVTQGNPAYYTRNVINGMFFMAANGLDPLATFKGLGKLKSTYKMESGNFNFDDMHTLRSTALGLVQGGSVAADVQSLMEQYESDPVGAVDKMHDLIAERWSAAAALLGKGRDANAKAMEKIGNLAAMSEGFATHAIFDDKVKMLTEAKFGTPEEIFREAARRTLRVVPAKSERPQAVTAFTQNGLSALVAPFIGFKSDMVRTTVNLFADAWADSKSDNPVIKAHGRKVLASASMVVVGLTSVLPMIAAALAGIGDDEDRAIRAALPEFAKNSSFIYWRDPKTPKQFTTFDLTFLNSYSFVVDPFTQGFTSIRRGRFNEIPELVARTFGQEVFGENVVAGAVLDVKRNIDESTKRPIYLDSDTFGDKTYKSLKHVFDSAYNPALVKKAMQFQDSFSRTSKGGENFWYTPQGVLLGSIAPLKPRVNQVDDLSYRALAKLRNANSQLWQISAPLKSPAALSPGDARDIVDRRVDATRRIFSEGYELVQGFRKLGMSDREIMQNAIDSGFSERSSKLLMQGYAMRPVLDKESLQKIYALSPERYHAIIDEQNKHAVYLKVSP